MHHPIELGTFHAPSRDLIREIIAEPELCEWTVQGFGMIRTYLDEGKKWRLNIWHKELMVPGISTIHDHPWSFTSYIYAGELANTIYLMSRRDEMPTHFYHRIMTGEEGGPLEAPETVALHRQPSVFYWRGGKYAQRYDMIHETDYVNGTVTLNDRTNVLTKDHSARVFWPYEGGKGKWVNAKPRAATKKEIRLAVNAALGVWS